MRGNEFPTFVTKMIMVVDNNNKKVNKNTMHQIILNVFLFLFFFFKLYTGKYDLINIERKNAKLNHINKSIV